MFGVGDGVTDDVIEEVFEHMTSFFVNQSRYTLDTSTTSKAANRGLRDALDRISHNFAMTLSSTLSEAFGSFSTSRHVVIGFSEIKNEHPLVNHDTPLPA